MDSHVSVKKLPGGMPEVVSPLGLFIVGLGSLFYFYEYILRISPSVMKPELVQAFSLSATGFGTLSDFYLYAYTPMQLVVGVLVDRFNLRLLMTGAVALCATGCGLMAIADSFILASAGRFCMGLGSAFAFVGTLKLAAEWLPANRFALFCGLSSSLGFLGAMLGETLLAPLVGAFNWRAVVGGFFIGGMALATCMLLVLPSHHPKGLVMPEEEPGISFAKAMAGFMEILKVRKIWFAGILSFLMYLPTTVFASLWGVPYLQELHGFDRDTAATATSMIFVGWALGCPLVGWLSDLTGKRFRLILLGALASLVLILALLYLPGMPLSVVCAGFVVFGIFSSTQALTFAIGRDESPHGAVGTAVAFVNMLSMLGGMIFQSGVGTILDWTWDGSMRHGVRVYGVEQYEKAMLVIPICLLLAAILAVFMRDVPSATTRDVSPPSA